jgi:hypothetical protein
MPEINPYGGEFEGRCSVPSIGVWGLVPSINPAYYQESKFGIAVSPLFLISLRKGKYNNHHN